MIAISGIVQCTPERVKAVLDLVVQRCPVFHVRENQRIRSEAELSQTIHHVLALIPAAAGVAESRIMINRNLQPCLNGISDLV